MGVFLSFCSDDFEEMVIFSSLIYRIGFFVKGVGFIYFFFFFFVCFAFDPALKEYIDLNILPPKNQMLAYLIFLSLHFDLHQFRCGGGDRQMTENIWLRDQFDPKIKKQTKVTSSKKSLSTGRSNVVLPWLLCVLSWNCL